MKRTRISRGCARFRITAIAVPALAGLLVTAMPAEAAEHQVFSYSVPAGAETVWIDIESPDVSLGNTGSETNLGSEWTTTPLRNTAFGVSAVIPVTGGQIQLRVNSSSRSAADVNLSFTGSDNSLISVESQRIRLDGGTAGPTPIPIPTATNSPGDGTEPSVPAPEPTPTDAPDSVPPVPEGEEGDSEPEETATPTPSPSSTSSIGPAGSTSKDDPSQGSSEASSQSDLASTGWSPAVLFGALGLLAAGAIAILIARKNGIHA